MNFLALIIIADFDDYVFGTVKDQHLSKLITDGTIELLGKVLSLESLTLIETTTSQDARFKFKVNEGQQPQGDAGADGANAAQQREIANVPEAVNIGE